jgi:hypothetical protein
MGAKLLRTRRSAKNEKEKPPGSAARPGINEGKLSASGHCRQVEGAWRSSAGPLHDVEVDHRCRDVSMTQDWLERPDVGADFKEVGCKGMAQSVATGPFVQSCLVHGRLKLALHRGFMKVMPGDFSGSRMGADFCRGEEILPTPLSGRIAVFPAQRFREVGISKTDGEILEVLLTSTLKLALEAGFESYRKWHHAMLASLAIVDGDGSLRKIEILDPEPEPFHKPQTAAIEKLSDELPGGAKMADNPDDFFSRQHCGRAALTALGRDTPDFKLLDFQDAPGVENQGVERLLFRGGSYSPLQGKVFEVGTDGVRPELRRCVLQAAHAEAHKARAPGDVGLLGGDREIGEPDGTAQSFDGLS